jgi:hypothetical protein
MMNALTLIEGRELTRLERVVSLSPLKELAQALTKIERDWESCRAALLALVEIRDRELYRNSNKTFDGYCLETWGVEKRWFDRLAVWMQVNEISRPRGLKVGEYEARAINAEANRESTEEYKSKELKLKEICDRRIKEREREEAQARRDRASLDRPSRDRLKAIKGKIIGALKLIDGSIDVADQLEADLQKALVTAEGANVVVRAA